MVPKIIPAIIVLRFGVLAKPIFFANKNSYFISIPQVVFLKKLIP